MNTNNHIRLHPAVTNAHIISMVMEYGLDVIERNGHVYLAPADNTVCHLLQRLSGHPSGRPTPPEVA